MDAESRHQCLIYEGAPSIPLPSLAETIRHKLNEGYRCMYLNSRPMVAGVRACLSALGINVAGEVETGRLRLSSEPVTAANGDFDVDSMLRNLETALDGALYAGYKGLWATGDMTWEFGSRRDFRNLVEYEIRLEALFQRREELHGVCQYHRDTLPPEVMRQGMLTHRAIFLNQTLSRINPHFLPVGATSEEIHTNSALDAEITRICQMQNTPIGDPHSHN